MSVEAVAIEVCRVEADLEKLLAPDCSEWDRAAEAAVLVEPTPLERVPSAYVQVSWRDRPRGGVYHPVRVSRAR